MDNREANDNPHSPNCTCVECLRNRSRQRFGSFDPRFNADGTKDKRFAPSKLITPQENIAYVQSFSTRGSFWWGKYLVVVFTPASRAIQDKVYGVFLYTNGSLINNATISWNQAELNVLKPKEVAFLINRADAHSGVSGQELSKAFTIEVRE